MLFQYLKNHIIHQSVWYISGIHSLRVISGMSQSEIRKNITEHFIQVVFGNFQRIILRNIHIRNIRIGIQQHIFFHDLHDRKTNESIGIYAGYKRIPGQTDFYGKVFFNFFHGAKVKILHDPVQRRATHPSFVCPLKDCPPFGGMNFPDMKYRKPQVFRVNLVDIINDV